MVKKWFAVILLIVFTIISVAALNGLARNMIQKRDLFSDPLCRVAWKKKKLYQIAQDLAQVKKLKTIK